jgi:hypothetical protein
MARRLLAGSPSGARTLAVAGNAHTPTTTTDLGVPLGACLARQRPGIREIQDSEVQARVRLCHLLKSDARPGSDLARLEIDWAKPGEAGEAEDDFAVSSRMVLSRG